MGRSPRGVATGVSGAAQTPPGLPGGQVPFIIGTHIGGPTGPAGTTQQSSPGMQQSPPQHVVPAHVVPAVHGASAHTPLLQKWFANWSSTVQSLSQPPQLRISLAALTQLPSQQVKPTPHAGTHGALPLLVPAAVPLPLPVLLPLPVPEPEPVPVVAPVALPPLNDEVLSPPHAAISSVAVPARARMSRITARSYTRRCLRISPEA